MNIGIDIRPLLERERTGVGVYQINLLKALFNRHDDVDYHLFSSGISKKNLPNYLEYKIFHKNLPLPNKFLNLMWLLDFPPQLNKLFKDLDILLMSNLNFFPLCSRVPLAVTVHDLSFLHDQNYYNRKGNLWHRAIRVKALLKRANKIITASEATKTQLLHYFPEINSRRIKTIYPGVNLTELTERELSAICSKLKLPAKYLLFLGTLEPRKNVASILKAFDNLPSQNRDLKLVIAGKKGWQVQELEQQICRHPNVIRYEYVDDTEKCALYQQAVALIWPSFYEGFGFPPLEALSFGTPVITSYRTSLPEVLKNYVYYINPYNSGELKTVIEQILLHPQRLENTIEIIQQYNWQKTAEETINFLKS